MYFYQIKSFHLYCLFLERKPADHPIPFPTVESLLTLYGSLERHTMSHLSVRNCVNKASLFQRFFSALAFTVRILTCVIGELIKVQGEGMGLNPRRQTTTTHHYLIVGSSSKSAGPSREAGRGRLADDPSRLAASLTAPSWCLRTLDLPL